MLSVHKFGGTSVGSAERHAAVADIIAGLEGQRWSWSRPWPASPTP